MKKYQKKVMRLKPIQNKKKNKNIFYKIWNNIKIKLLWVKLYH